MDVEHIVKLYLSHKEKRHEAVFPAVQREVLVNQDRVRSLHVMHGLPTGNFGYTPIKTYKCVNGQRNGSRIPSFRRFSSCFARHPEAAIDCLMSVVINSLIDRQLDVSHSRRVVRLCILAVYFISSLQVGSIKVKRRIVRATRLHKTWLGWTVTPRDTISQRSYNRIRVLDALRSCIYLKSALSGLRLSYKIIITLVKQVCQLVKCKLDNSRKKWVDLEITKVVTLNDGYDVLETGSNFIANALCHQKLALPLHYVLKTSLSHWRSFRHSYTTQMFHTLVLLECVAVDCNVAEVLDRFRAAINTSLNKLLFSMHQFQEKKASVLQISSVLYHFYGLMNRKMAFHRLKSRFAPHLYNVEKMIPAGSTGEDDCRSIISYISHVKWIIMVSTLLLDNSTDIRRNTWIAIQIMAQFFLDGGLRCGLLRCQRSNACIRCLTTYTDISVGLYTILTRLRKLDVYPFHVTLLKILLKNALSRVYATFGSIDNCVGDFSLLTEYQKSSSQRVKGDPHRTPMKVSFAAHLIRQVCLKHASRKGMNIKQKHYRIDVALPFPTYLKLLFSVHNNVPGIKVLHNADKVLRSPQVYELLDHLAPFHVRNPSLSPELRSTTNGRLPFQGIMAVVAEVYLFNKMAADCLWDLVVKNQLNVMQRTQACHMLAKNPHVISLALPQLVQSLAVDPGNRVWHLLSLAMRNHYVRERAPYFTACMIHANEGHMDTSKAKAFLELTLKAASTSTPRNEDMINIYMHSQLLNLTSSLVKVDPDERTRTLQAGIRLIHQTVVAAGSASLFDDTIESAECAIRKLNYSNPISRKVLAIDARTAKVLKSATRSPFMLDFHLANNRITRYIYKMDDDMRQDALVVQIKVFMLHIFRTYRLEAFLQPFLVVPYSTTLATMVKRTSAVFELLPKEGGDSREVGTGSRGSAAHSWVEKHPQKDRNVESTHELTADSTLYVEDVGTCHSGHRHSAIVEHMTALMDCISCHGRKLRHQESCGNTPTSATPHLLGGTVGFIPGTISRHTIGKDYNISLEDYFELKFGPRGSYRHNCAMDNFVNSLAGYSLLCFLLQVKDRHNGNLLISPEGHIIHIDFGFILGASPAADVTFEQAPFKLTKEMIDLLGGIQSDNFHRYVRLLVSAYLAVRQEAEIFIALVKLLEHSNMASFRRSSVLKLKQRFCLDSTPERAANFMIRRIHVALHSKTTMLYDIVQGWQQGIQH